MKLSVPIDRLKRRARSLRRSEGIPLHAALDRVAAGEGYPRWSLLAARHGETRPAGGLESRLRPGEMLLLAARPGQGKTLMGLALAAEAAQAGRGAIFFSLEYTPDQVSERLGAIGFDASRCDGRLEIDCSAAIGADHIFGRLTEAPRGMLVVVDYLQLLDQRRASPALSEQLSAMKIFARARGLAFVFLSQIDRSFELSGREIPCMADGACRIRST